uniref:Uncharacterized protein n=1 Tax=Romanomermis culicivorax TaxID=13658 RepID=A0A915LD12_ROMCU
MDRSTVLSLGISVNICSDVGVSESIAAGWMGVDSSIGAGAILEILSRWWRGDNDNEYRNRCAHAGVDQRQRVLSRDLQPRGEAAVT